MSSVVGALLLVSICLAVVLLVPALIAPFVLGAAWLQRRGQVRPRRASESPFFEEVDAPRPPVVALSTPKPRPASRAA